MTISWLFATVFSVALLSLSEFALSDDVGSFWVVSDIHLDEEYAPGSPVLTFCHPSGDEVPPQRRQQAAEGTTVDERRTGAYAGAGDTPHRDFCVQKSETPCDMCQSVLCYVQQIVEDKDNVTAVIEALEKVCSDFGKYADECKTMVEKYGKEIAVVFEILEPFSICRAATICNTTSGVVGDYWCSTSKTLMESTMEFMKKTLPDPDFIIFSGDAVGEIVWLLTKDYTLDCVDNVTNFLTRYFPDVPMFPVIGNHDCYPKDQLPLTPGWLLGNLTEIWRRILPAKALAQFAKEGYYQYKVKDGLSIIGLNTEFYYPDNKYASKTDPDPVDQLKWLKAALADCAASGEKAIIVGHVPPGPNERAGEALSEQWLNPQVVEEYYSIVVEYGDVILSQHFGHEHSDSFRLFFDDAGEAKSVMYIAPAVTPRKTGMMNNPGVRQFRYSRSTGKMLDMLQYYCDLDLSNEVGYAVWDQLYTAKQDYGLSELSPSEWHELVKQFSADDNLYQLYFHFNAVGAQIPDSDKQEKKLQTCAILNPSGKRFMECMDAAEW